jgi:hypothetical protein
VYFPHLVDDLRDECFLTSSELRTYSRCYSLLISNSRFFTFLHSLGNVCSEEIGAGKCRRMADLICAFPVALEQHLLGFQVGKASDYALNPKP